MLSERQVVQLFLGVASPERGLVISYAYLWQAEHVRGREEGTKDRPCVIVVSVENVRGEYRVTVVPVTHSPPSNPDEGVEIPLLTKRRLGLDDARSWIVVTEANRLVWPGPDLRSIAPEQFDYGFLPPALFQQVQVKVAAYAAAKRLAITPRTT